MLKMITNFAAETSSSESGIGAFNVNLKGFVFQLITFLIVLLVLKRWVFPKLVSTLEARRAALEQSLTDARKTREALSRAEEEAVKLLSQARAQADQALADAGAQAKEVIAKAEADAEVRTSRLLDEARAQIDQERAKLRQELKDELTGLVVDTTQKILGAKVDSKEDRRLIEQSIKEVR